MNLTTDAKAFQYKSGGDEAGVTERLQGVQRWDPVKAGIAIVYERKDGTRVVADGHQRLGLAKKMAEQGQDPHMLGVLMREVDGFTVEDVREAAALKNIAEGNGRCLRCGHCAERFARPRRRACRPAAEVIAGEKRQGDRPP